MPNLNIPTDKLRFFLSKSALPFLEPHITYSVLIDNGESCQIEIDNTSYNLTCLFHAGVRKGICDMTLNLKTA